MTNGSIVIAALPIGGLTATEAASRLTRALRAEHPDVDSHSFVQLPLVDGSEGTIDLLVTNTLGSFLEVEATGAAGEQLVVPLGFAGEDSKLGVIEMQRVSGSRSGEGTTFGVGELILDALDEGAFSVLLGQDEPIAADAGMGAAAALGVKFFDGKDKELDMRSAPLASIARIDATGRAFQLLSSRFFIAQSAKSASTVASQELCTELARLSEIIRRDVGIPILAEGRSASAVEFGLEAFLSVQRRDGMSLVIEATGIQQSIDRMECSTLILLVESASDLKQESLTALLKSAAASVKNVTLIFRAEPSAAEKKKLKATVIALSDAKVFAAPLPADASVETLKRDTLLRLEKLAAQVAV